MDKKFDTAFIPQQPLLKVEGNLRLREQINLPLIIGFVCVFISVVVYGGVYFYKSSVDRRITTLEKELESKEESLQISEIDRYKSVDTRIGLAKQLLQGHAAFSSMLGIIEKVTAENIGWTALSYAPDEESKLIKVNLTGQALDYSAVYVQAEAWRGMPEVLRRVEVGLPVLNPEDGTVSFGATLTIDPALLKYSRTIANTAELPAANAASVSEAVTDPSL